MSKSLSNSGFGGAPGAVIQIKNNFYTKSIEQFLQRFVNFGPIILIFMPKQIIWLICGPKISNVSKNVVLKV